MISINGLSLPSPHALTVQIIPKGGTSQYNALGQLVQEGVREKRMVEITWQKDAYNAPITFYDKTGSELVVARGQSFVSVITDTASVDIE